MINDQARPNELDNGIAQADVIYDHLVSAHFEKLSDGFAPLQPLTMVESRNVRMKNSEGKATETK